MKDVKKQAIRVLKTIPFFFEGYTALVLIVYEIERHTDLKIAIISDFANELSGFKLLFFGQFLVLIFYLTLTVKKVYSPKETLIALIVRVVVFYFFFRYWMLNA